MVSIEKIVRKFEALDEYLSVLRGIGTTPAENFVHDKVLIGSARYYLQVSVESCLDVANHVIASERLRAPKDYADSFSVLEENGLFSRELCLRLRQMAKFRNRLVHLYGEIDDLKMHKIINNDLKDIESFRTLIVKRYYDISGQEG